MFDPSSDHVAYRISTVGLLFLFPNEAGEAGEARVKRGLSAGKASSRVWCGYVTMWLSRITVYGGPCSLCTGGLLCLVVLHCGVDRILREHALGEGRRGRREGGEGGGVRQVRRMLFL